MQYNVFGASVVTFVGALLPPSGTLLKAEHTALQRLGNGPWHAISGVALCVAGELGLATSARSVRLLSLAASCRLALTLANDVKKAWAVVQAALDDPAVVLAGLSKKRPL